ncbi:RNA-binding protein [Candidatus Woesearchaeota archaeon]|nr:RNA-binding protein [Candidatus Woesearchaeota archaeon]
MSKLLIEDKEVVIPGQILAEGMDYLPSNGAIREGDNIISTSMGVVSLSGRLIKIIPLTKRYVPQIGDVVVGFVKDLTYSSWFIDIGYSNDAVLSMKDATSDFIERGADLTQYFSHGDYMVAKIANVTKTKAVDITMREPGLKKLYGGKIIEVNPARVPRIIGKQGSMIKIIKDSTGCMITVGQNGIIWLKGPDLKNELIATEAIMRINECSYTQGLTEQTEAFLKERTGGKQHGVHQEA